MLTANAKRRSSRLRLQECWSWDQQNRLATQTARSLCGEPILVLPPKRKTARLSASLQAEAEALQHQLKTHWSGGCAAGRRRVCFHSRARQRQPKIWLSFGKHRSSQSTFVQYRGGATMQWEGEGTYLLRLCSKSEETVEVEVRGARSMGRGRQMLARKRVAGMGA